jgi:ubiquinone/menaquinone biosynthesis C-methylase UbiE
MSNLFGGLAAGYATARPPVHSRIVERLHRYLRRSPPTECALDVGCGAGLSTRALARIAPRRIGVEPSEPMLRWARKVDPGAEFVVAVGESLPFPDALVDLITAAGSLNYVHDPDRFFAEAARVLRPGGFLAIYDFSQGTRATESDKLETGFGSSAKAIRRRSVMPGSSIRNCWQPRRPPDSIRRRASPSKSRCG